MLRFDQIFVKPEIEPNEQIDFNIDIKENELKKSITNAVTNFKKESEKLTNEIKESVLKKAEESKNKTEEMENAKKKVNQAKDMNVTQSDLIAKLGNHLKHFSACYLGRNYGPSILYKVQDVTGKVKIPNTSEYEMVEEVVGLSSISELESQLKTYLSDEVISKLKTGSWGNITADMHEYNGKVYIVRGGIGDGPAIEWNKAKLISSEGNITKVGLEEINLLGNFVDEKITVTLKYDEEKSNFIITDYLAKKVDADVVLANDPDADRLGIYAKDSRSGEYKDFTGNMSALLIAEYRISQMKEKGILPENGMFISTVVSSNLAKAIAKEYNLDFREVLTGFKNIGEQIKIEEQKENGKKYVFGFEESYGCLIGDYARDKDGISAVMSLCEAACFYREQGITLWDQMINIYEKYGYYKETQVAIVLEGASGAEKIKQMMENMRNNLPEKIGNYKVLEFKDIKLDVVKNMVTGEISKTGLPTSNVLYYELENDAWCCVRPSGTEPKIKLYMGVKADTNEKAEKDLESLKNAMREIVK